MAAVPFASTIKPLGHDASVAQVPPHCRRHSLGHQYAICNGIAPQRQGSISTQPERNRQDMKYRV